MNPHSVRRSVVAMALLMMAFVGLTTLASMLPANFAESQVVQGLASPTAMAFAPDGRLFVCQQGGQLRVIEDGVLLRRLS